MQRGRAFHRLLPGFEARLRERFPKSIFSTSPATTRSSPCPHGGVRRLGPAGPGRLSGNLRRTSETLDPGIYQVVVEYTEESVGRLAHRLGRNPLSGGSQRHAFRPRPSAGRPAGARRGRSPRPLHRLHRSGRRGPGHPHRRLTEGSLVQFGWGSKASHPSRRNRHEQRHRPKPSPRTRN